MVWANSPNSSAGLYLNPVHCKHATLLTLSILLTGTALLVQHNVVVSAMPIFLSLGSADLTTGKEVVRRIREPAFFLFKSYAPQRTCLQVDNVFLKKCKQLNPTNILRGGPTRKPIAIRAQKELILLFCGALSYKWSALACMKHKPSWSQLCVWGIYRGPFPMWLF